MIKELIDHSYSSENMRLTNVYIQLRELLSELKKMELTPKVVEKINQDIQDLNDATVSSDELRKLAKRKQTDIVKRLEKELKIVPINYYRNLWLALGIAAIGIPIGVAVGAGSGNMGMLGIGAPIGMAVGLAIGTQLDKKAYKAGKQLGIEIK